MAAHFLGRTVNGRNPSGRVLDVPELTDSSSPGQRLELVAEVDEVQVALEHTIIESYSNQIRDGKRLEYFGGRIRTLLPDQLPPGYFKLAMATNALEGITGGKQAEIAAAIAVWVRSRSRAGQQR